MILFVDHGLHPKDFVLTISIGVIVQGAAGWVPHILKGVRKAARYSHTNRRSKMRNLCMRKRDINGSWCLQS